MQDYAPQARFMGIDSRNVLLNTIRESGQRVGSVFYDNDIDFYQISQRKINQIPGIRNRVHLITCVGAAYDDYGNRGALLPFVLRRFSRVLSRGGMAQVFISVTPELFEFTNKVLTDYEVPGAVIKENW